MKQLKVAITLPYLFTVRDFLFTPMWDEMEKNKNVTFYIITTDDWSGKVIKERNCPNIIHVKYPPEPQTKPSILERVKGKAIGMIQKSVGFYIDNALLYRYAAVNNLSHYRIRGNKSPEEQKRHQVYMYYMMGERAGWPFRKSRMLFRLFYELRYIANGILMNRDKKLLKDLNLDLLVFGRLNIGTTIYWSNIAKKLGIPMVGIVSSWDHPTTQGPTPRGMSGYIVASKRMTDELSDLQGIDSTKIRQVGKVQMDIINKPAALMSRAEFFEKLGIQRDHKLITFGTNCYTLKDHEVSIARHLAEAFKDKRYGYATLLLRTHPQDGSWKEDFQSLENTPWVLCQNASSFSDEKSSEEDAAWNDQVMLINLMKHSDLVIQSRGSMALDAIAHDRPVISLSFDGDLKRAPGDSFVHENDFEHYKPLVAAKGMWMVGSYDALDRAIREYLADPSIHAEGRRIIREDHIEPLDGLTGKRTIDYIVECAEKAQKGELAEGDWDYNGLGDTTWFSRQQCRTIDYLDM